MDLIILALIAVLGGFLRRRLFHVNESQQRWGWVLLPVLLVWAHSLTYVSKAIENARFSTPLHVATGIGVVVLSGVALLWCVYHWVRKADEMIRRAETESMALGLGLGLVSFIALNQLAHAGFPVSRLLEPVSAPVKPFFLGFVLARVIVYLRYR